MDAEKWEDTQFQGWAQLVSEAVFSDPPKLAVLNTVM